MFGFEIIDIVVIVAYFAVVLYIGFRAMKNIHTQEDYFLGGRRFGKLIQTFAAFGQGTSSESAVGTITTTYNNGASGIWSNLLYLWSTPIYWFTSPWYRRMRVLTLGDFFEERYGSKRMSGLYSIIGSILMMAVIALGMKAVSSTMVGITQKPKSEFNKSELQEYNKALELGRLRELSAKNELDIQQNERLQQLELQKPRKNFSYINENIVIWTLCVVVFIYAITGGLGAAMRSDMLQGIFIIILSIILIPFGLFKINSILDGGGLIGVMHKIHEWLPESYFDIFGSTESLDFTWYYIIAICLLGTINVAVQPNQMNAIGSAKDELTARIGFTAGCFMKRFCILLWGFFFFFVVVLYSDKIENPDYVWGYATRDLLGGLHIGLVGLMVASLMAALMSTADMLMITTSGLLTHNLYKPLLPDLAEAHYVKVGRVIGGVVLVGAVLLATWFDSILQMMKFIWEFNAIMAAVFWCGIKWRRANRTGAWSSIIVAMLTFVILPAFLPLFCPGLHTNSYLLTQTDPRRITRVYTARVMDVKGRNEQIQQWHALNRQGQTETVCPLEIKIGQEISKTMQTVPKSIFWSKGIREKNGVVQGEGLLYIEMVAIDQIFNLSTNSYALNETIRTLLKIILPFFVMIVVSVLTIPDDKERLARFYVKMRTPANADKIKDRIEVENSYKNPNRFRERLLLPRSNFEFFKWDKIDTIGFSLAVLIVLGILGTLYLMLHIGAR